MNDKVFIIAEAGVNHNGSIELAKRLIDCAHEAGADAVKFQSFRADSLVTRHAEKAGYQIKTTGNNGSQWQMLRKLELDEESHRELMTYARAVGIMFLSSPFDLDSIDLLDSLGLSLFKIPSGELNNLPYLRKIGRLGKPVILSTGMATLGEIEQALEILRASGTDDITVLHCNTEYPTPYGDVHLRAMRTIGDALGVKIGYSDHTLGIEIPIAAVALGARVIEKHITLDKQMDGPDHKASLDPPELQAMVVGIRNVELALGHALKQPSASEWPNRLAARKSVVAARFIRQGEPFTEANLAVKRPGSGISPMRWDELLGRVAPRDFEEDELIEL